MREICKKNVFDTQLVEKENSCGNQSIMNYPNVFKLNLSLTLVLLEIIEIIALISFSHFIVQSLVKTVKVIEESKYGI